MRICRLKATRLVASVAVRYAWAADPACTLFNGAGLPASPFRTDTFEIPDGMPKK